MKKSEIYRKLQIGLFSRDITISPEEGLEILRELMEQEDRAKFFEEQEAKQE